MSESDDAIGGCIGAVVVAVLAMVAVVAAVMILTTVGSVFGAGTALRNYGLAFRNNVKPEGVTP
jgi:hypothetical protein